MSRKKITVIGRGTAGALAITHFRAYTDFDIDWHFDPNIQTQAVGEGSNLYLPELLKANIDFQHSDLANIDGTFKHGIRKIGWKNSNDFFHNFPLPNVAYHFNAVAFQNHIYKLMKDKVNIVEGNVASYDDIDSDFIFDCSGAPKDFSDCNVLETIPVNSVYVTQCYWDVPKFQHTLTIARPHGWVFGIPLGNRCSIGYMYNNTISTIEEVQEDVKGIFEQFNLTPSSTTNSFSFKNYYRKQNFQGRIAFGGNASFFLEPLEATSIGFMDIIQRLATDRWSGKEDHTNEIYLRDVREYEVMIMLHYLAESNFDTDFWRFARERTKLVINHSLRENQKFTEVYQASKNWPKYTHMQRLQVRKFGYGSWSIESFYHNLSNLGLYSTLDKILDI